MNNFLKIFRSPSSIFHLPFSILCCALFFLASCGTKNNKEANQKADTVKTSTPVQQISAKIYADSTNPELYVQRSRWYLADKKYPAALRDVNKALSFDSSKAGYYLLKADISFANMDIQGTEDAFKEALVVEPQNVDALLKLSEMYLYVKKYGESLKNADAALRIDKHRAKGYFIKGFVFKEIKDTARAVSSFETCIEQQPDYYDAYIQLGNIYADHGSSLAVSYYDQALKLQPHSTEAYYNRGLYFQNTGQLEKAISDYNALLKIDPEYANAYYNLGYIESNLKKNYSKAIEYFSQAIGKSKYYVDAYYNRGVCYELSGNKQKAREDYRKAISIFPTHKLSLERLKKMGS